MSAKKKSKTKTEHKIVYSHRDTRSIEPTKEYQRMLFEEYATDGWVLSSTVLAESKLDLFIFVRDRVVITGEDIFNEIRPFDPGEDMYREPESIDLMNVLLAKEYI